MRTDDLDFTLPREMIATTPAERRDASRLLVVQRSDPTRLEHRVFADLPSLLSADDLLVFNRSRVVPARLVGKNIDTSGGVTGLYLQDAESTSTWIALIKMKRARAGKRVMLQDPSGADSGVTLELLEKSEAHGPGAWIVAVDASDGADTPTVLERTGWTPLPPYILGERQSRGESIDEQSDRTRYQTVFAGAEAGSVAAPTAGLHFNDSVLKELKSNRVRTSEVVLHVGAGTFKPVETETLDDHPMHSEWCSLGESAELFKDGKPTIGRVLAVGSTSARTLESYAELEPTIPESIETRILIQPGYKWKWVDGMLTNFHLPRSTLLAMVAALLEVPDEIDGVERVQQIYAEAIKERYRFYSFGDAMLILP